MEKLTAGQCLELVKAAVDKCSAPDVMLLGYVCDSLIQQCTDIMHQLEDFRRSLDSMQQSYDLLNRRYSELQYLAKARSKDD